MHEHAHGHGHGHGHGQHDFDSHVGCGPGRVQTQRLQLPAGLTDVDDADLVWASMMLHHLDDEADALGQLLRIVAPDGVLALVERADCTAQLEQAGFDMLLYEKRDEPSVAGSRELHVARVSGR